ncbi:MAG: rhodanese-like domain-containing protein [Pseudomonadota bacterium]
MTFSARKPLALAAFLGIALAAGALRAQSSFDEGSFETGTGAGSGSATQPQPGAAPGGGFDEGSFETGSATPGPSAPADTQPAPGGSSVGSGFGESSFEPGGSAPATELAPPPRTESASAGAAIPPGPTDTTTPRPVVKPQTETQPETRPGGRPLVDPQITAFETRDFGVPPQNSLRQGQFHGPTPTVLPGGYLVTTENLIQALNGGTAMIIIDVLGSGYGLPSAYNAPGLAAPGSYNDRTQQQAAQWLLQISAGRKDVPLVIYCSDPMCWLSYNAGLRAIAAGHTQVYWYRGGLQAWEMSGLPMMPIGF